jgi:L-rhamnose mutarotase
VDRYESLHAAVWPTVLSYLGQQRLNYSIYRYSELLFSYMEYVGDDFNADMAGMAARPSTPWWAVCMPLQRPFSQTR